MLFRRKKYSSAANGVAERTFGIIFGSVRILLLEAKMAHVWWAEACDYIVKAGNLLPSSRHPGKVPEEVWSGKKADSQPLMRMGIDLLC